MYGATNTSSAGHNLHAGAALAVRRSTGRPDGMTFSYSIPSWLRLTLAATHRGLVRPVSRPMSSWILRRAIRQRIGDTRISTILDPCCGDDPTTRRLAKRAGARAYLNDIDQQSLVAQEAALGRRDNVQAVLTCGDLLELNSRTPFSLALMKNALHHMADEQMAVDAVRHLASISTRLMVIDIEDPSRSVLAKVWNCWYRLVNPDEGDVFYDADGFQRVVRRALPEADITFSTIHTVKGRYLLADALCPFSNAAS